MWVNKIIIHSHSTLLSILLSKEMKRHHKLYNEIMHQLVNPLVLVISHWHTTFGSENIFTRLKGLGFSSTLLSRLSFFCRLFLDRLVLFITSPVAGAANICRYSRFLKFVLFFTINYHGTTT